MAGEQIAPDEKVLPELAFDFDGKRDRWNGYDPREHKRVVQEHLKLEEAKRVLKAQQMNESLVSHVGTCVYRNSLLVIYF